MRNYVSGLFLILFSIACGRSSQQSGGIPIDKMKVVVLQLMKADEHYSRVSAIDSTWRMQKKNLIFYQQIFDFNKVDRAQFYKQIEYLEKNPIEFKVLMDSVNELSKREKIPV